MLTSCTSPLVTRVVSLTFDDGLRCQFEKAVPILDRLDLIATFFLTANQDSTHDPWDHPNDWLKIDWRTDVIKYLRKLVDRGHEIGSHSLTHHIEKMQSNPADRLHDQGCAYLIPPAGFTTKSSHYRVASLCGVTQ
jgi:peptidoglycan/xylan/chitin deacetylase (PgdA/CDA1 family)